MGRKKKIEPETLPPVEEPRLREDQYEVLVAAIRRIENDLTSIDRDLEHDRRDMQDFKVRLGTLEGEVKQLREAVNLNAERVRDRVADALHPVQKEVKELKETVDKKRVLAFNKKRGFLGKFFKR